MRIQHVSVLVIVATAILASCGPQTAPGGGSSSGEQLGARGPKTLTIALEGEPGNLDSAMEGGGVSPSGVRFAVQRRLTGYDNLGELRPQLATRVPAQADGTWVVRPDGTMQTTYTIRPNVTWHDGAPLTSRDFVFAWQVHTDRSLPIDRGPAAEAIERIDTPDSHSLVIEWRETYPFANAITQEDLGPLPAHLLEAAFADKERFPTLPYWKREFVGVGPYRLAEWEPASHMTLKAYERFYGGPPKVETVILRFIESAPTAMANLLAGSVDGVIPRAIDFTQAMFVKAEWEQAGRKPTVLVESTHWRFLSSQFREARANPPEIRDIQVRRALLHAIDRRALSETLLGGQAPVSDTLIPPDDPRWEWVRDVPTRYEYDPRRALDLLGNVGWRRGGDGMLVNPAGQLVTIPIWTTSGEQNVQEQAIVSDNWKAIGVTVQPHVIPQAQQRDRELRASYPAFDQSSVPLSFTNTVFRAYSGECPREPRWAGSNRGCYQNPEMDRAVNGLARAIEPDDQRRFYRDLVRVFSEDLAVLPLYFNVEITVFRDGVTGIKGNTKPRTSHVWNIEDWDVR